MGKFSAFKLTASGGVSVVGKSSMSESLFKEGVSITGDVDINKTKFLGGLAITGKLNCEKSEAKEVAVVGETSVISSTIDGQLAVTADQTLVKDSRVKSILVKCDRSGKAPIVKIFASTVGCVKFDRCEGIVVSDNAQQKVENGLLQHR